MKNSFTILSVEDLKNNRDLVRRILESQGYKVVDAENGLEGVSKAVEISPDLILMDINLPDIDGFSAVTKIRSYPQLASVPIVALTARNVSDDVERAIAIGCDGYLSKPFGVKDLIYEVSSRIGKPRKAQEDTKREKFLREQTTNLVTELQQKFSELTEVHEELNIMHERLQRLDQAKTDFIHIASHELRTPLTMLHVYTDMLRTNPKLTSDKNLSEMIDGLRKGVDRLSDIINDMISIGRVELSTLGLVYSPLSIRGVIESVVRDLKKAIIERNLTIEIEIQMTLPSVVGDSSQLTQIFKRLIGNAIKYTPDYGKITVSAIPYHGDTKHLSSDDNAEFIQISVQDTGIGINREDQRLIFEKFYTAAEDTSRHSSGKTQFRAGGPGLGLTIAKGVVEAHGGSIWVESDGFDANQNPGSTFHVLLPCT